MKQRVRKLLYGDCFNVIYDHLRNEKVDCIYIDPPFNSKRNYNIIHRQSNVRDFAQSFAYSDLWVWNEHSEKEIHNIYTNKRGYINKTTIDLLKGLEITLGRGQSFSYLVYMTSRIIELHSILKKSGSMFLHCDKTMVHYLKIIMDSVFEKGEMINEIIWFYYGNDAKRKLGEKHDTILWYPKNKNKHYFNTEAIKIFKRNECNKCGQYIEPKKKSNMIREVDPDGRSYSATEYKDKDGNRKTYKYYDDDLTMERDVWIDIGKEKTDDPKKNRT